MAGLRIGIGGIGHETNTFRHDPTELDAFFIKRGEEIVDWIAGTRTYPAGMLDAAAEIGATAVPTFFASANPSGVIARPAFESLLGELLDSLRAQGPLDAVALFLHGAGVVDGMDDLELAVAEAVRELIGPDRPLVVAMDLHGNVSDAYADTVDVLLPDHLYPHTDMYERGHEAVSLIPDLVDGALVPETVLEHLPMVIPATPTTMGIGAELNDLCWGLERDSEIVDCAVFHGFPYADVPLAGVHVVVTANRDRGLAESTANLVAEWIWERRERFLHTSCSAEEAVARALEADDGLVVINEAGDNPGAGGPGDGTHLLRAILAARPERAAFGFIRDPEVVEQAIAAGVGARINAKLGGRYDDLHGPPLEVDAYVKCITDGEFALRRMAAGLIWRLGPTVRLDIDGVDVIVSTKPEQTLDDAVFALHGIDVGDKRLVGLKSSAHFRAGFQELASEIIEATTPGLSTPDVTLTPPRTRTPRPIWPLDSDASYAPGARLGGRA